VFAYLRALLNTRALQTSTSTSVCLYVHATHLLSAVPVLLKVHDHSLALQGCIVPYLSTLHSLLRDQRADSSTQCLQLKVLQLDGVYENFYYYSGRRPYMPNPAAEADGLEDLNNAPAVDACGAGTLLELHLAAASDAYAPTLMYGQAMSEAAVRSMLKIANCQVCVQDLVIKGVGSCRHMLWIAPHMHHYSALWDVWTGCRMHMRVLCMWFDQDYVVCFLLLT
jgi:hypothetical protein